MRTLLYVCFFLSGAAALIYEIVWHRMLTVVFGLSTLSVAAVLSAFLAGMAVGARAFGPAADRTERPIRLYALIQLGIGITALLSGRLIPRLMSVYEQGYTQLSPSPMTSNLIRFGLAFAAVGIPSVLIGGTVPVSARLVAGWAGSTAVAFGRLNAANSLGAVLGAAVAGFVLLPVLGVSVSLLLATAASGTTALIALGLGGGTGAPVVRAELAPASAGWPAHPRFALIGAALTGAAALAYEAAWIRLLAIYTFNSVYVFTMVVTTFLAALAIGSGWAARHLSGRSPAPLRRLALLQGLLALGGPLLLALIPRAATLGIAEGTRPEGQVLLAEYLLTIAVVLPQTVLIGAGLPLLIALYAPGGIESGRRVGTAYAWNAAGNIVGAALTGAAVVPLIGMRGTLLALSAVSFAVGGAAWALDESSARSFARRGVQAALAVVLVAITAIMPPAGRFYRPTGADERILYYAEGPSATVHVSELEADGRRHRTLFVDSQSVAGTYDEIVTDQKMLAHLPLLLHPSPRRALTVGFGTGGTSYSMLLHPGVAVDCVEIEPRVAEAYRLFESENLGLVGPNHERHNFHLVIDDARAWLHVAPHAYDVIVTDVTSIQYRGNGNLYTTDYFELMKGRLTPTGLGCAWVPITGVTPEQLKVLIRSFRAVYPHTSVWYMINMPTDFVILVGSPSRIALDLADWSVRMSRPSIHRDLTRVGLADPFKLAACLLLAEEEVSVYAGEGLLHTDDCPVLDYMTHASRNLNTFSQNLSQLRGAAIDTSAYVVRWPPSDGADDPRDRLRPWARAAAHLMDGHIHLRGTGEDRLELARDAYLQAAALVPTDARTQALLADLDPPQAPEGSPVPGASGQ